MNKPPTPIAVLLAAPLLRMSEPLITFTGPVTLIELLICRLPFPVFVTGPALPPPMGLPRMIAKLFVSRTPPPELNAILVPDERSKARPKRKVPP